jgi:alpha-galactosidase
MKARFVFLSISLAGVVLALPGNEAAWGQAVVPSDADPQTLLAPTPPMGWNSWNWFGKQAVNERVVVEVIDALVESGLRDAGYRYVVIDGGWRDTQLGPHGELQAHPEKFPHGIRPLAEYAHAKRLKLGLHTVPGTHDCIGDPVGGFGREATHVQQLLDWGIDFVKLDQCRHEDGWTEQSLQATYCRWSRLLQEKAGHRVLLSISAYRWRDWYPDVCQMARTTEDISAKVGGMSGCHATFDEPLPPAQNKWGLLSVMEIAEINNQWANRAGGGYWNDPDMLVTGEQGLSYAEQKSHFALWCIMSAPLMLGNDPRQMSAEEKSIILNKVALAINQDPTEQGSRMAKEADREVWVKRLRGGAAAVLLLNRNRNQQLPIKLELERIGITSDVSVKEVFESKDLGTVHGSLSLDVAPRSSLFLLLTK